MHTSLRAFAAASLVALGFAASPAMAQDEASPPDEFTISGYVQGVTDYRYRGYSLSAGDAAVQGSINVNHKSGFYAGAWASSLDAGDLYGEVELDLYAGWTGEVVSGLTGDVGMLTYVYPSNDGNGPADYWEPYASLSTTVGPFTGKVGVAYAWEQDSLADEDNLYLFTDVSATVPSLPITVSAHLGYTDGVLGPKLLSGSSLTDDDGFDYSAGVSYNITPKLSVSATYVGVDGSSSEDDLNAGLAGVVANDTVVGAIKLTL